MYLKSIEIHGFKSFANKILFQFHDGITAIVGPNGSGKSNVADAVRWVLGEQRIKQLRGASMQDVIFSGTELRKPQGYAYVAITLDNSDHALATDFEEVTVARRLYRSGESEYILNGTPCKLKDVNELFYDTGIGKEGYSIIGQGQIDKILSGKPEERRELFDEAAGIVKFKKRKAAASKKLEDEANNLVRITDILSELEKQVGPLEKQSEKAKIYLKKKEELKSVDVNMFLLENDDLESKLEKANSDLETATEELEKVTAKCESIKAEFDMLSSRISELDESINSKRTSLSDTNVLRGKLEGQINVLKEQINSAKSNEEHFRQRVEAILSQIKEREKEKEEILKDKSVVDKAAGEAESIRNEAKEILDGIQTKIEELNSAIESGKNTIIDTLNNRANIKSKISRLDQMSESIGIRKSALTSKILKIKSDEVKQAEEIKALEAEFDKITQQIDELKKVQDSKEEELALIREDMANKNALSLELKAKHDTLRSNYEALENITERYEGYGGSVQTVMEQKKTEKKIIGVVADIISVDPKFEVAIETALGGNIQNIVTEDEATATRMISLLKSRKAGRATFLPLTSLDNPQEFKNPEALNENGVIGMADELVNTEKKYRNVAKAMLGRIMVVDHVDNALKIARKFNYGIRMVTLEGELLVPGGAISGGAFKKDLNLLARRRQMEELKEKAEKFLNEYNAILEEIKETKERRNALRIEIEENKSEQQRKMLEQNTARLNIIKAQERKDEALEDTVELRNEEQEIEANIKDIAEQRQIINEELSNSLEMEKSVTAQVEEFQKELDIKRDEETDALAKVSELDVQFEKMLQQQGFHQQNVDRIESELEKLNYELDEVNEGLKSSGSDVEEKEKNILEIKETIKASFDTQSDTELSLGEDEKTKEELVKRQKEFFNDSEALMESQAGLDKEVYRLTNQKERFEESIASLVSYMFEEYEITLVDAPNFRDENMKDLSTMKKESSRLKSEIKSLGDVNVNAIEDYKNLMERYTFLKTQHDDLVEAKKTLEGIIVELDSAMRKQFSEKFKEIEHEFNKVFKELFGGGTGSLELMEDEDILEAGIRIIAQPPGKKLQNMMQLSGGEKSLTAIALLFAIQNLKPSPFCLLDEIEAALDESNVSRYASYLHKLTKHTQFIVITHRRGTMEKADRLYGITMQEKGVSALVSVNLINEELDD